jgi:tetratricopeptide (TPR) repeat protein
MNRYSSILLHAFVIALNIISCVGVLRAETKLDLKLKQCNAIAEEIFERAVKEIKSGNRSMSKQLFKNAIKSMPNCAELYARFGEFYYMWLDETNAALEQFEKSNLLDPSNSSALYGLWYAKYSKNIDLAVSTYSKMLSVEPNNDLYEHLLCLALFYKGEFDQAASHCERSIKLYPQDRLLSFSKHYTLAFAYLRRAEQPDSDDSLFDKAAAECQKVIQTPYYNVQRNIDYCRLSIAIIDFRMKRFDNAEEIARQLYNEKKSNEQVLVLLEILARKKGLQQKASEYKREVQSKIEKLAAVDKYNLACLYAIAGHEEDALTLLEDVVRLDSTIREYVLKDRDWVSLRSNARFQKHTQG